MFLTNPTLDNLAWSQRSISCGLRGLPPASARTRHPPAGTNSTAQLQGGLDVWGCQNSLSPLRPKEVAGVTALSVLAEGVLGLVSEHQKTGHSGDQCTSG